ncbi:hypothetical protein [Mucilaginibacter sp. HD30]
MENQILDKKNRYILFLCVFFFGFLLFKNYQYQLFDNLDPSWIFTLNYASSHNLMYGNDIVFTYGPLGFLGYNSIVAGLDIPLLLLSIIIKSGYSIYFFFIIADVANKIIKNESKDLSTVVKYILVPWFFFKFAVYGEFTIFFLICLIHSTIVILSDRLQSPLFAFLAFKKTLVAAFTGFTTSMLFFVKVSFFPFLILVSFLVLMAFLIKKQGKNSIIFLISAITTFTVIYLSTNINLSGYLLNSLEIINGYKKANQIFTWPNYSYDVYLSIALILLSTGLLLTKTPVEFVKKNILLLPLFFLTIYFLFIYSYTRGFTGGLIFNVSFFAIILFWLSTLHGNDVVSRQSNNVIILILFLSFVFYADKTSVIQKKTFYSKIPSKFLNKSETFDIYPYLTSLCYSNGLRYLPRPVLQSYSAYTKKLDSLDASFFANKKVDNIIFHSNKTGEFGGINTIDGRYFMYDEPLSKLEILKSYYVKNQINDSLFIASKRQKRLSLNLKLIRRKVIKLNEVYQVNADSNKLLFFIATVDYTRKSKLLSLIKRMPYLRVKLFLDGGRDTTFNLVSDLLQHPCVLNKYCADYNDYFKLMNTSSTLTKLPNIRGIKFLANVGSYQDVIDFKVYEAL